jgi:RNA polymerase sigma-70 factor (ECF subfamily)
VVKQSIKSDSDDDGQISGCDVHREHEEYVARLFKEHNQALLKFVSARLHSRQEAMEITQEAYVRLLKLNEPNTVSYLRAYLFRIAANLVNDRIKQRHRRSELRELVFFEDEYVSPPPETSLSAQDELNVIECAITELPAKCQKAFLLHKVHGFSVEDVAMQMNLSGRMVRLYVARALEHCREHLERADSGL